MTQEADRTLLLPVAGYSATMRAAVRTKSIDLEEPLGASLPRVEANVDLATPQLLVVVDTEEEFDWDGPFSRSATATSSIAAQAKAHEIFDCFGIVPTYVVDYPVATNAEAAGFLHSLKEQGRAQIGAHLHPWVTPPFAEEVSGRNSYGCNLPADIERAKIATLTAAIAEAFGERPIVFKAGRHGIGPSTIRTLVELGYRIDCSWLPHSDLRPDGGPNLTGAPDQPYWLAEGLLEVPVSAGFFGHAAWLGPKLGGLFDAQAALRWRLPGLLARTGLVTRSRLTPEGVPLAEQCRLVEAMVGQGKRVFTLVYHSPSLAPGHTPYVRDSADLAEFLLRLDGLLTFFRDRLGGNFTTLREVYAAKIGQLPA